MAPTGCYRCTDYAGGSTVRETGRLYLHPSLVGGSHWTIVVLLDSARGTLRRNCGPVDTVEPTIVDPALLAMVFAKPTECVRLVSEALEQVQRFPSS